MTKKQIEKLKTINLRVSSVSEHKQCSNCKYGGISVEIEPGPCYCSNNKVPFAFPIEPYYVCDLYDYDDKGMEIPY